jgi:hypothetical protein
LFDACGFKSELDLKKLINIWYMGTVRGAISFGLVLKLDERIHLNRDVIITTCLSLIVFTQLFFGGSIGIL